MEERELEPAIKVEIDYINDDYLAYSPAEHRAESALAWLRKNDHEGAGITVWISGVAYHSERAYRRLEELQNEST